MVDHSGRPRHGRGGFLSRGTALTNVKTLRGGIDAWSVEDDSKLSRYDLE